ncbi:MAG: hypothetical protein RIS36_1704 [Pseudomonadota bacterium]|jgi:ribosomal-protein-alanine N-acetyltransferase
MSGSRSDHALVGAEPHPTNQNTATDQGVVYPRVKTCCGDITIEWFNRFEFQEAQLRIETVGQKNPWHPDTFRRICSGDLCCQLAYYHPNQSSTNDGPEIHRGVVGYVIYTMDKSDKAILGLAVTPAFQGNGIGRMLVEALSKDPYGVEGLITAEVDSNNSAGLSFFARCGFTQPESDAPEKSVKRFVRSPSEINDTRLRESTQGAPGAEAGAAGGATTGNLTTILPDQIQIRWLIQRDLEAVVAIEQASKRANPWTEDEFLSKIRQRNCFGVVAEYRLMVLGFIVYELYTDHLSIINIAVGPSYRRSGIATCMIDRLKEKLWPLRRSRITLWVGDSNVNAQLFFREQGFKATGESRHQAQDSNESEPQYFMEYLPVSSEHR